MKKEKLDKIFLTILCVVMIISSIFVGSPLKHNYLVLSVIINIVSFVYMCINCIINPKRDWIDNILSIGVVILTISSCIPIILKNCISISDSIESFLTYISFFSVFFLLKEIQISNKKKYITYSIIISACILCVIGFDNLTYNVFEKLLRKFGNLSYSNPDNRMFANFGYANSFALYIAIAFLLTLNEYKKEEKEKLKLLGTILMTFFMICILLSYSRGTWICLIIFIGIEMILGKDKTSIKKQMGSLILSLVLALIFVTIYYKLQSFEKLYIYLVIILFISALLNVIIHFIKNKVKIKNNIKINYKYIIAIVISSVVIGVSILIILLKFTQPLVLFTNINEENEYVQNINYISDKDGYYEIEIDIEANSMLEDGIAYEIIINEKDKYNGTVEEHYLKLNNEKEIKKISFKKQEDTKYLSITYRNLYNAKEGNLTINSLVINGENIVVDYKYLPTKIIEKIKNSNSNNISIWERFIFIRDGIKAVLQYGIIGLGGNAWEYIQYQVQEYRYTAKEVHSYPIEIFMEFGIIGFLAFILIVFYVIKSVKEKQKRDFSIVILLMLLHSCFDFDMSFYIIQLTFFALLACISTKEEKNTYLKSWSKYIIILITFIGLIGNSLYFISDVIYKTNSNCGNNSVEMAKTCIEIYPFYIDARSYLMYNTEGNLQKENILWWIKNEIYRNNNRLLNILSSNIYKDDEYIELSYQIAVDERFERPFDVASEFKRYQIIEYLAEKSDGESKNRFIELLKDKKQKLSVQIQSKESRLTKEEQRSYLEGIEK